MVDVSGGVIASFVVLVICALVAVLVWNYPERHGILGYTYELYPYRPYVSIFAIGAFIGLGGLLYSLAVGSRKQETNQVPNLVQNVQVGAGVSQIICGTCGSMNDIDAVYCKKCGNQLS